MRAPRVFAPYPGCIDHVEMLAVVCKGFPFLSLPFLSGTLRVFPTNHLALEELYET